MVRFTQLPLLIAYFSVDNRIVFCHDSTLVGAGAVQVFELFGIHIHHLRKASLYEKGFNLTWRNEKQKRPFLERISHVANTGDFAASSLIKLPQVKKEGKSLP